MHPQREYDVIVVGAGGSGLAAACSVAQHGGHVLVLEAQPQPGGTTGIAVGSYTAAETRFQRQAKIEDHVEDHCVDAGLFATPEIESRNNTALRNYFLSEASDTLDWLTDLGLSFIGPNPEPPNRVPRMHNVVSGAKAYVAVLQMTLQRLGGELLCDVPVESLLKTEGRVIGVRICHQGVTKELFARRGVILAGGDYANNAKMIAKWKGEHFREIEGINPHALGEGHRLAIEAGAQMVNMDVTYGPELRFISSQKKPFQQWLPSSGLLAKIVGKVAQWMPRWLMRKMIKRLLVTWQHPENQLFEDGAILINAEGHRFVNETQWPQREIAVARQPGKIAYILLDGRLIKKYSAWPHFISTAPDIAYAYVKDYQRLRPDVTVSHASLAEVVSKRGIPLDNVSETVEKFNQYTQGEREDEYGRQNDREPLKGPWVLLGPVKAYFTTTEGGAMINHRLQVLDENNEVILGLYAVGQNGLGGMILWGHGLHIAWAMTSGRLVGNLIKSNQA